MRESHNATSLRRLFVLILVAIVMPAVVANARPTPPDAASPKTVESMQERGLSAQLAQDFAAAQGYLEAAYLIEQRPLLLFLLGRLAQADKRPIDAEDYFRRFVADPHADPGSAEYAQAQAELAALYPPSGELFVQGTPLSVLRVDKRMVGVLPLSHPVTLAPGAHEVSLSQRTRTLKAAVSLQEGRPTLVQFGTDSDFALISHPFVAVLAVNAEQPALLSALREQMESAVHRAGLSSRPLALAQARQPLFARYLAALGTTAEHTLASKTDYVVLVQQQTGSPCSFRVAVYAPDVLLPAAEDLLDIGCDAVASRMGAVLDALLTKALARPRQSVQLASQPAGAALHIDGIRLETPAQPINLWHGTYDLSATLTGYQPLQRRVSIDDSTPKTLAIPLSPIVVAPVASALPPPVPAPRKGRPLARLLTGGALLGSAALLFAIGGYGLAIDGRCVAEPMAPVIECPQLVDAKPAGIALVSIGAGMLLGGGILLALPAPSIQRPLRESK